MDELFTRLVIIETAFTLIVRAVGILGASLLLWFLAWAWMRGRR